MTKDEWRIVRKALGIDEFIAYVRSLTIVDLLKGAAMAVVIYAGLLLMALNG